MQQICLPMTKLFLCLTLFVFSANAVFAGGEGDKTGTIKGNVTTSDNKAAAGVTVIIKSTKTGTITDENGVFEFLKLKAGSYTLQISLVGYETTEQTIAVTEGKIATLSFQLKINQSKYTKSDKGVQGNRPLGVPNNVGNIWASYSIPQGAAKGLGVGFGVNYNGDVYFDDANKLNIPSYTILKTTLFYNQPKFRLSVTADNLGDTKYWNFHGMPQMPRRLVAGLSVKI